MMCVFFRELYADEDIIMVLFSQLKLICFTSNQWLVLFKM